MSTPVPVDSPPGSQPRKQPQPHHQRVPTPDLQAQMQHMIDLQYEQQNLEQEEQEEQQKDEEVLGPPIAFHSEKPAQQQDVSTSEASLQKLRERRDTERTSNLTSTQSYWSKYPDDNVGQGTLYYASPLASRVSVAEADNTATSNTATTKMSSLSKQMLPPLPPTMTSRRDADKDGVSSSLATSGLAKSSQHTNLLSSYGAVDDRSTSPAPPPPPPPLPPQQIQEHDFHYGNPDYHDPFAPTSPSPSSGVFRRSRRRNKYCCLWDPLVRCCMYLWRTESLYQAFCFGAIDGMLTGSGIVSAFCGMGLLTFSSSRTSRSVVVVFAVAACVADSVCMALGHVWTTHMMAVHQAKERVQARQDLVRNKADAKGQLVDMLLAKGMLKIDAMSLADTLEGYPDLFVSVLLGDSLSGADDHSHHTRTTPTSLPHFVGGGPPDHEDEYSETDDGSNPVADTTSDPHPHLPWHTGSFPSYGRLPEAVMDPEAELVNAAVRESRLESLFTMVGFSLLAILPSLIFWCVPVTEDVGADTTTKHKGEHLKPHQVLVSPGSAVISLVSLTGFCLGVWKSRFLDGNWLVFGIEAVMVLLVCIVTAYVVGAMLSHWFLPHYVLQQMAPVASTSSATDDEF